MKILVNAFSVAYGGGLIRTLNIINTFEKYPEIKFLIVAPDIEYYKTIKHKNVDIILIHGLFLNRIFRIFTDIFWLPWLIVKNNPDLILCLSNLPVLTKKYQIFLHDNPLVSVKNLRNVGYKRLKDIIINRLRNKLLIRRIKYIDHIIAQTNLQLNELRKQYPHYLQKIPEKSVLTPYFPEFQIKSIEKCDHFFLSRKNSTNLLCLSRYYPHKNIEILFDLARIFKQNKSPFNIILTISRKHGREVSSLLRRIDKEKLSDYIRNIGEIPPFCLTEIMNRIDALILPSLLESFSLTYAEAMFFRKPIFTSDLDFAHEACKNGAFYFNPYNAESIYTTILSAFNNHTELKRRINNQKAIIKTLHKWDSIIKLILMKKLPL